MASQSALVRTVFICLWSMSDDEGRLEGDAMAVWRFGSFREDSREVASALETLRELSRVVLYEVEGNPYIQIVNFTKHQRIDHPSKSKYPEYTNGHDLLQEHSRGLLEASRKLPPDLDLGAGSRDQGSEKSIDKPIAPLALPAWLNKEAWENWVKIRPAKARTPAALTAAIAKLEKFRTAGHDGNAIIAESLSNGWQGLFEPKKGSQPGAPAADGKIPCRGPCGRRVSAHSNYFCAECAKLPVTAGGGGQ